MHKIALVLALILALLFSASVNCNSYALANCTLYSPTALSITYSASASSSGGWIETYGGDYRDSAQSVIQTSDGGYVLAGYTGDSRWLTNAWLAKTDSSGNIDWAKTYREADTAESVIQTSDGGYALAGTAGSNAWLAKTDSSGNIQWDRTYEGNNAFTVIQTSDGGYALAGSMATDFWLVKTDKLGNIEWSKTYGEGDEGGGSPSFIQTSDGGYALVGTTTLGANGGDFLLVKTDSKGNMEWSKTYGSQDKDGGRSIIQTSDGGYALAGLLWNRTAGGATGGIIKTDSMGDMQWMRTYNVSAASSIIQTSDGGYAIMGSVREDSHLVETDSEGKVQWIKVFKGTDEFIIQLNSIIQTSEGYVVAGNAFWPVTIDGVGTVTSDSLLIKTESEGNNNSATLSPNPTTSPEPILFIDSNFGLYTGLALLIIIVTVFGVLLFYFKKHKH
jgi:hypothetical protein